MAKSSKFPLVEVIILTHNSKENLKNCLNSLKKSKYPNLLVTLVDQNTTDKSLEMVKRDYKWVNLVENKINNGFVGGCNQILKKSKAKYSILLNDDTIQEPSWISNLVKKAESDDNIAALQPKIRALNDKKMFEYAGAAGGFIDIYGYPLCRGRVFNDLEEDNGQYDDEKRVFWCCGVALLLRNSVLKKIGYLDEDYFFYSEELDLCWRLNIAGYKQFYVPSSVIYHIGSGTSSRKEYQFKKFYYLYRNTLITILKNYQIRTWFKILPVKITLDLVAIIAFMIKNPKQSLAIAKADLWVLFHLNSIIKKNKVNSKLRRLSDKEVQKNMVKKSIVLQYFLLGKKKFKEYTRYIDNY